MKTLVFCVEGKSEKMLLKGLIPRLFDKDKIGAEYILFDGKSDLKKNSLSYIRKWHRPDSLFVVLIDQNGEDCQALKAELRNKLKEINPLLIRIACHELESWYFGDLSAVGKALGKNIKHYSNKQQYREPDKIPNPSEQLSEITDGYYQKISSSREIAKYLALESNSSPSFNAFINGIKKLVNGCLQV